MGSTGKPLHRSERAPFISSSNQPIITVQAPSPTGADEPVSFQLSVKETSENGKSSVVCQNDIETARFSENQERRRRGCSNYIGILLALLAGFVFTIGTILVKYMKHYHPFTLAMYRLQGVLIPSICMVFYAHRVKKVPVFDPFWPVNTKERAKKLAGIILRASFGCTALFLHLHAIQYLQVGDVAVLGSCKPVFVTIAAFLFLGESCGIFPILMAVLTMVGVGVITRPPMLTGGEAFDQEALTGIGFAMGSVLTDTLVVVIIRYLKEIHVSIMMLFLGLWGTFQSVICAYAIDELKLPETGRDWAFAVALAATAIINQVGMNLALQFEIASTVSLKRTLDIVFAFLLQFIILSIAPDLYSISGALVIITCVLLTAFRKWLKLLPNTHSTRRRYRFILI